MAKCLVLGANGFIGSHLTDALVAAGHDIVAFDRFGNGINFNENPKITLVNGDFLNRNDLAEALQGADYVFHFISTTTPITAENDPLVDIDTNIRMSVALFQECVKANVKRVIFASTGGAIYGSLGDKHLSEDDVTKPISPYAIGKLTIENYLRYFNVKHGLDSLVFRISNPYGERQPLRRKQGVIPIFLEHIYRDEPITILGDGSMVRDYIYIKDVARMVTEAFDKEAKELVYNLASGQGATINELVENAEKISGKEAVKESKPTPSTFVDKVVLDTTKFQNDFGIKPEVDLQQGMKFTWDYIVAEHEKEGYK